MRISYDDKVNGLYVRLVHGSVQCHTLRLNDEVGLNLRPREQLVGIEILNASQTVGESFKETVELENIESKVA